MLTMTYRKYGFTALGLSLLAALSAMALVASAAQAAPEYYVKPGASFVLAGLNLVSGLSEGATVAAGGSELLIANTTNYVFCEHGKGHGTINNVSAKGVSTGTIEFKKCKVLGAEATCKVVEPIVTKVKDELITHGGEPYDIFKPETGEIFTELKFENKGAEECLYTGISPVKVKGSIAGQVLLGAAVTQSIHFNNTVYSLICETAGLCGLKFGEKVAKLDGDAPTKLLNNAASGFENNEGKEWEVK
jgi:hypothetical protein